MTIQKIARNDPCPCGSGKKYKQCCLLTAGQPASPASAAMDLANALQRASEHYQAGQLREADAVCQQILQLSPNHPDALHMQGMIAYQIGMLDVAAILLGSVTEIAPNFADGHNNLGVVLMAQGALDEAIARYRQAIALQPNHANAHYNLGNALKEQGRMDEAIASYRKAVALTPNYAQLHSNLGDALQTQGRLDEAIASYRKALRLDPDLVEVHYNLGDALREREDLDEAAASYRRAIERKPDYADAYNNLGNVLKDQDKQDEAAEAYQQAIRLKPDFAEAYNNLGVIFQKQDKLNETIACCRQAVSIKPDFAEAYSNLGEAFYALGRLDEAIASNKRALEIRPDSAETYNSLGNALRERGRLDEAAACGRQALLLKPDFAEAYNGLGNTLQAQGRLDEAIACYRQVLSFKPDSTIAYSNLLYTMQYMDTVTPAEVFSEHQRYAERFETPLKAHWRAHANSRDPGRRLRIGYVSADFYNHAVAFFIEPILAGHDKSQVEIYCYYNHIKRDAHTEQIAAHADHWLACSKMSDEQLAERIRADGIDILVDLSGHTGYNRLPVFARKPAPVQATWIGYAGSTGLTAMDYRITNAEMDPPGLTERYHSESLVRMPDSGVAYRPAPGCPSVNPLPALSADTFVFASLNNLIKINPSVVHLWARILEALPHARLMLGNITDDGVRQRVIKQFSQAGVEADRLILQPRMSFSEYLALHHTIDLALDPFPYNGGTTTMHSLWMGVPVITLAGEHMVSRCAVPLLSRVGLSDFITHNEEDYFQLAMRMAQDLPGLDRIRQSLRERMTASNYGPETVTRHLEAAYREMWRTWCSS
ncbi:MAG: tetratricopeptide repeat protein [Thiobacillus sp.]|uniref:tetratricopeptide repeat protein n=1 Tax=Thiobacillus sp. TaxID=924 RepID=UPI00168C4C17|nr:tetratricopeptide repeat protein [Thiobacillus sp.]QLQ02321.1 MAG: tetratricopeptide repeat protein [Thiobacillus sp.]